MAVDWTRQPLRIFLLTYIYLKLATVVFRLPWWITANIRRSWRPRETWTMKRCIMVKLILFVEETIGPWINLVQNAPDHRALLLRKGIEGLYVDGVPELVTGKLHDWAVKADVYPIRLPGYWMHKKGHEIIMGQKPSPDEKILYFLHGGSYTSLSAHPNAFTSSIPRSIMEECPSIKRTFAIEYRLSLSPSGAFPSALIDALAGYVYLVNEVGFSPSNIVIAGDSAGGNLAQALARYLVEYKGALPSLPAPPSGLLLISPWCDMSGSHTAPKSSMFRNAHSDTINGPKTPFKPDPPAAFIAPHSLEFTAKTPYISPSCKLMESVSFKGFPKTFITSGDAEILLDQICTLHQRMTDDLGEQNVMYYEAKDAVHDYLVFGWHEPERGETLHSISEWIERL